MPSSSVVVAKPSLHCDSCANRPSSPVLSLCSPLSHRIADTHTLLFASPGPARWLLAARAQRGAALHHALNESRTCAAAAALANGVAAASSRLGLGVPRNGRPLVGCCGNGCLSHHRGCDPLRVSQGGQVVVQYFASSPRSSASSSVSSSRASLRASLTAFLRGVWDPTGPLPMGHGSAGSDSAHGQARARVTHTRHRSQRQRRVRGFAGDSEGDYYYDRRTRTMTESQQVGTWRGCRRGRKRSVDVGGRPRVVDFYKAPLYVSLRKTFSLFCTVHTTLYTHRRQVTALSSLNSAHTLLLYVSGQVLRRKYTRRQVTTVLS